MSMQIRDKIKNKFIDILQDTEGNQDCEKEAENLEQNIYNLTIQKYPLLEDQTIQENPDTLLYYMEKSRSLYDNLNPNSYFDTKEGLIKFQKNNNIENIQEFKWKTLWKTIKQKQEILDKNLMGLKPTTETDQFLCKKCKERKTTFYTMQIRSADEAETSFITCLNCGYSWREG